MAHLLESLDSHKLPGLDTGHLGLYRGLEGCIGCRGLGFRVQGLGFRGLGFRVLAFSG